MPAVKEECHIPPVASADEEELLRARYPFLEQPFKPFHIIEPRPVPPVAFHHFDELGAIAGAAAEIRAEYVVAAVQEHLEHRPERFAFIILRAAVRPEYRMPSCAFLLRHDLQRIDLQAAE